MIMSDYLSRFPGASREKPRIMALAKAVLRQAADMFPLAASLQSGFSFALAEGVQLDALAASVGLSRESGMADEAFRQYLLSKLALWTWDGTNEGGPGVLGIALPGTVLNDNQDGTVTVLPPGIRQNLLPVPAGIQINDEQ